MAHIIQLVVQNLNGANRVAVLVSLLTWRRHVVITLLLFGVMRKREQANGLMKSFPFARTLLANSNCWVSDVDYDRR